MMEMETHNAGSGVIRHEPVKVTDAMKTAGAEVAMRCNKHDVGDIVKTTTSHGGGGPAKGEKPEVNTDCCKMDGTVGRLGSSMALKSKYKLAAVSDPDAGKDRG